MARRARRPRATRFMNTQGKDAGLLDPILGPGAAGLLLRRQHHADVAAAAAAGPHRRDVSVCGAGLRRGRHAVGGLELGRRAGHRVAGVQGLHGRRPAPGCSRSCSSRSRAARAAGSTRSSSSGTTSKQVQNEADVRPIGYGAMLLEAMVAVFALACVMILTPGSEAAKPDTIYALGIGNSRPSSTCR